MSEKWVVRGFKIALFLLIVIAGFGQAVLQLWNWLIPSIFGLPAITFWQAVGLLGLSWILFGGWRGPGFRMPRRRGPWDRWEQLTPEQRERFRRGLQQQDSRTEAN